jgi:SnoaL-like domain
VIPARFAAALLLAMAWLATPALADMNQFAVRYSAAWSSQDPARVAAFHADNGSLTINGGTPSVGRAGITEAVRAFMSAYPDMVVELDSLEYANGKYRYHWRFTGTNSGPGGTGRPVKIGGFEEWTMGADGLIAASQGHYDAADWDRQVGGQP